MQSAGVQTPEPNCIILNPSSCPSTSLCPGFLIYKMDDDDNSHLIGLLG